MSIVDQLRQKIICLALSIKLPLSGYGMGRIVQLDEAVTIEDAVSRIKKHLEISHVRLALARKASLQKRVCKIMIKIYNKVNESECGTYLNVKL